MRALLFVWLGIALSVSGSERLRVARPEQYSGLCDASGAVPISSNVFAVASDEDNILRLYRSDLPGPAVKEFDLNAFLEIQGRFPEVDLEAAARIGNRAFWIGSHGCNKSGKERLNRHRFFATDIQGKDGDFTLTPVGRPYQRLLDDLLADSRFDQFHLAEASRRAPKDPGALNIEGLSATPEGHLLIGFRNPIPAGQALLIPLLNPNEVIAGKTARFDSAVQLDLHGLGIRDMVWHGGAYTLLAGSSHGGGHMRLYRWTGPGSAPELKHVDHLNDYHPEALIIYPEHGLQEFQILSDDGTSLIDGCPCKELKDPNQRTFRSFWVVH